MTPVPKPTHRKPVGVDKERQDEAGTRRRVTAEVATTGREERSGDAASAGVEGDGARTKTTGASKRSARRQPSEAFLKAHGRDSETMAARQMPATHLEQVGEFSSPEHFKRVYCKETGTWSLVYTPPAPQRPQISPRGLKSFPMSPEMAEELQRIKPPTPREVTSLPPARASRVGGADETSSQVAPIGAAALRERLSGKRLFRERRADGRAAGGGGESAQVAAGGGRGAARGDHAAARTSRAGAVAVVRADEEAAAPGLGGTAAAEELQLQLYLAQEEISISSGGLSAAESERAPAEMSRRRSVRGQLRSDGGISAPQSLASNRRGGDVVRDGDEALAVALAAEVRAEAEAMVRGAERGLLSTQNESTTLQNEATTGRGLLVQNALQSASQTAQTRTSGSAPPAHARSVPTAVGTQRRPEPAVGSVPAFVLPTAVGTQRSQDADVGSTPEPVGVQRHQALETAPGARRGQGERDSVRALLRGGVGGGLVPGHVHTQRRMRRGEFELEGATYEQLLMLDEGLTGLGKGLKKDKIDKVKRMAIALRNKEGRPEADCCICLETLDKGGEGWALMCRHHFHEACIVPWLTKNAQCPNCRAEMTRV